MARRIIEFPTPQAAAGVQNAIHNHMAATVIGYNAERWSEIHAHPEGSRFAITIKPRCRGGLNAGQLSQEKDAEPGWFPGGPE